MTVLKAEEPVQDALSEASTSILSAKEFEKQRMNSAPSAEKQTVRNETSREDLYSRCRAHVISRINAPRGRVVV